MKIGFSLESYIIGTIKSWIRGVFGALNNGMLLLLGILVAIALAIIFL